MLRIFFIIITVSFIAANQEGYFGEWPINPNKDKIQNPGFKMDCALDLKGPTCPCSTNEDCASGRCFSSPRAGRYCLQGPGTIFPRFKLMDQFGEEVDLYDFAGHGKLIIIEMSTGWCAPCQKLAAWLTDDDLSVTSHKWWKEEYSIIKELVDEQKIFFINIQVQDSYKTASSLESLEDWYNMYPDEYIPLLADSDYNVRDWVRVSGYPTIIVLNDEMEIVQFSLRGWHDSFNLISSMNWETKGAPLKEANE